MQAKHPWLDTPQTVSNYPSTLFAYNLANPLSNKKIVFVIYGIVPLVVHRIIGGDVYRFAKYVGVSVISTEEKRKMKSLFSKSGFSFVGENVIFDLKEE